MLSGQEFEALQRALVSAYPDAASLEQLLKFDLDKKLNSISSGGTHPYVVFQVIEDAEAKGWTSGLIAVARSRNPGNPVLAGLELEVMNATAPGKHLELLLNREAGYTDTASFISNLKAAQDRAGSVSIDGHHQGTCFLVGRDLVLTNYHVVNKAIEGSVNPERIAVRFGWLKDRDGYRVHAGEKYGLAADWLVAKSPYSPMDLQHYDPKSAPETTELDYALIRLDSSAADQPANADDESGRGWHALDFGGPIHEDSLVVILQHPCARPLVLDWGSVLGLNKNGTRFRHTVNTEPGSSGSPILNRSMDVVGIHHAGQPIDVSNPCQTEYKPPDYNQGIPIGPIREHIRISAVEETLSW